MVKVIKREVCLVDEDGLEWVRATLSATNLKKILKDYERLNILLKEAN